MAYDRKLIQGLEKLKERFRTDIDEHDNYNLIQDAINEIKYIEDEKIEFEESLIHDLENIESTYQDEIGGLENKIYDLEKQMKELINK